MEITDTLVNCYRISPIISQLLGSAVMSPQLHLPASMTELLISTGVHSRSSCGNLSEPNPVSTLHGNRSKFISIPRSSILSSSDTTSSIDSSYLSRWLLHNTLPSKSGTLYINLIMEPEVTH